MTITAWGAHGDPVTLESVKPERLVSDDLPQENSTMRMAPDYTLEDERRDNSDDRAQLIKVRAMAEALMRELHHPMMTAKGQEALHLCKLEYEGTMESMLVDELNPTIRALED